jgi:hypothetical protein
MDATGRPLQHFGATLGHHKQRLPQVTIGIGGFGSLGLMRYHFLHTIRYYFWYLLSHADLLAVTSSLFPNKDLLPGLLMIKTNGKGLARFKKPRDKPASLLHHSQGAGRRLAHLRMHMGTLDSLSVPSHSSVSILSFIPNSCPTDSGL